jgi:2'-5' RNA ligase
VRLFIAIEIDEAARHIATRAARALAARIPADAGVRWVSPENLHLTVRFIGQVPKDAYASLRALLTAPAAVPPFTLELGGLGVFPKKGPPRVVWLAVERGQDSLRALNAEFDRRLAPLGFPPEDRPFAAHLTLGRLKHPGGAGRRVADALREIDVPPAVVPVRDATLFESVPGPAGPSYRPLMRIALEP